MPRAPSATEAGAPRTSGPPATARGPRHALPSLVGPPLGLSGHSGRTLFSLGPSGGAACDSYSPGREGP